MGVDTTIYLNHNLDVPAGSTEIIELLKQTWKNRIELFDQIEISEHQISDPNSYKILINPKLIEYVVHKFNQITISTDFEFTMNMRLYENSICIIPTGIGRYATDMIVEFMDEPFGIYENESDKFIQRKKDWQTFKIFLKNISIEIGSTKHLYLNDSKFEGIGELAMQGLTVHEMSIKAKTIINPCLNRLQFVEKHTWLRQDGIKNIKDDVWFIKEINK